MGMVLTRFFMVGPPFSAIRGARWGAPAPRRVTRFRLLLDCGVTTGGSNFFLTLLWRIPSCFGFFSGPKYVHGSLVGQDSY